MLIDRATAQQNLTAFGAWLWEVLNAQFVRHNPYLCGMAGWSLKTSAPLHGPIVETRTIIGAHFDMMNFLPLRYPFIGRGWRCSFWFMGRELVAWRRPTGFETS